MFLQTIFILVDIYVIGSFTRFVKAKGWNMWIAYSLILIAIVMALLSMYGYQSRLDGGGEQPSQFYIFMIIMIWYLPKFMILPFLLISHITSGIKRLLEKRNKIGIEEIRKRNEEAAKANRNKDETTQPVKDTDSLSEEKAEDKTHSTLESEIPDKDSGKESPKTNKDIFEQQKKKKLTDPHKRREFIRNVGWGLAGVPFVITGYGGLKTLYDFEVRDVIIPIKDLPRQLEGLRIAQLSDLHLGSFPDYKPFQEAVRIFNELKADISVVTGDFVNFNPMEIKPHFDILSSLYADIGLFGCMGNHDHYMSETDHTVLKKAVSSAGIDVIDNGNRIISIDGAKLNLMGVDNTGMNQQYADFAKADSDRVEGAPTVLLCHDPRNWDNTVLPKYKDIELMLAGHTHGGQIAFELMGLELQPVSMVYSRYAGLYKEGSQYLYVNRGTGTTGPPIRIGVNPEITVFKLVKA